MFNAKAVKSNILSWFFLLLGVLALLFLTRELFDRSIEVSGDPGEENLGTWNFLNVLEEMVLTVGDANAASAGQLLDDVRMRVKTLIKLPDPFDRQAFADLRSSQQIEVNLLEILAYSKTVVSGSAIKESCSDPELTGFSPRAGAAYELTVASFDKKAIGAILSFLADMCAEEWPCDGFHVGMTRHMKQTHSLYFEYLKDDINAEVYVYRLDLWGAERNPLDGTPYFYGLVFRLRRIDLADQMETGERLWNGMAIKPMDRRPILDYWGLPEDFACE